MTVREPGKTIDEVWLFITDQSGEEGVVAFKSDGTFFPMVAADLERVETFRPIAQEIATMSGHPITVRHLTNHEDVEVIQP